MKDVLYRNTAHSAVIEGSFPTCCFTSFLEGLGHGRTLGRLNN